ncbi:MAG TPA: hypothetical protein VFV08_05850, partial [Puia sp.]|nr:hypothetical protein [Puia sp.]
MEDVNGINCYYNFSTVGIYLMAEFTLLQMVQNILSRMSSDEVNSISDTTESLQVANIIQNKFFDMVARGQFPDFQLLIQLDPSLDPTKPTLMYVPDSVSKIKWIKYFDSNPSDGSTPKSQQIHDLNIDLVSNASASSNVPPGYVYVQLLTIEDFLAMVNRFNTGESNVFSYNFSEGGHNFKVNYKNNHQPKYACVISDAFVLFDTYDVTQDDTLQSSKTLCMGEKVPDFILSDTFIPPLDDQEFPLLLNE